MHTIGRTVFGCTKDGKPIPDMKYTQLPAKLNGTTNWTTYIEEGCYLPLTDCEKINWRKREIDYPVRKDGPEKKIRTYDTLPSPYDFPVPQSLGYSPCGLVRKITVPNTYTKVMRGEKVKI
jgi:hypothetical protein